MAEVLVADDTDDIRLLVVCALEDAGYTVLQAANGEEAVAAVAEHAPDVLVLDVMMPRVDGFGALQLIREAGIGSGTRVLMLTSRTAEHDHLTGLELGAHAYLTKPFHIEDLVGKVDELLALPAEVLEAVREAELEKAQLLDRLGAAFR